MSSDHARKARAQQQAHLDNVDPVGRREIADRLDVKEGTVDTWRQRDWLNFPAPRWTVGGRPAWDWSDITDWAANRAPINEEEHEG